MTLHLGNIPASSTIYIPFNTYDANGASVTITGLATSDILIYKNGSTTQRSSTAGFTLLDTDGIDFDGLTGIHGFSVDLSDNTDSGFYTAGSFYWVVVSTITANSQTVAFVAATFRITAAENTSGTPVVDVVRINNISASSVTTINANIGQTQPVNFTGTGASALVKTDMVDVAGAAVSTSTAQLGVNVVNFGGSAGTFASGRPEVNTSHIAGSAVSTSSAQIGVNVVNAGGTAWASGSLTSGVFATGAITATAIAADAIGASELAADAVAEIADAVWDEDATGHQTQGTFGQVLGDSGADSDSVWSLANTNLDATVSSRLASASYTAPPSAATNAAAVWDLDATAHQTQGTFGQAIGDPGADTDTIFGLVNTNLDAAVSSRLASGSYTAPDNSSITAIKAKTDNLPTDPADESLVIAATDAIAALIGTPAVTVSADVAAVKAVDDAIKAKTDSLTYTVAGQVDANIQSVNDVTVTGTGAPGDEWGPP